MQNKHDVGIFGLWWSSNYGSVMTYYSLCKAIESLGYSVIMVDRPGFKPDNPLFHTHARRFAKERFPAITPVFAFDELRKLNDYADCFVMGSDQVWNFGISKPYRGAFFLNFADDTKKKMAYAASFGHPGFYAPDEEIKIAKGHLERFDAISVRETDAVGIVNRTFGLKAERVLDPVFIADPSIFRELAEESSAEKNPIIEGKFIATYILDPSPEKSAALQYISREKSLPLVNMLDGYLDKFEENKEKLGLENAVENLQTEDWLYYIQHCSFFVTDSCHGVSFAIINRKSFICIGNKDRGMSRFQSLMNLFQVQNRLVTDAEEILKSPYLLEEMDYSTIDEILKTERERSRKWLEEALRAPILKEKDNRFVEKQGLYKKTKKLIGKYLPESLKIKMRRKRGQ